MSNNAIEIVAQGRVQGVGFRYFCQREAVARNIKGYVKNLLNGDVEIVAEGVSENIDAFVIAVKHNHPFALVTNLIQKNIPFSGNFKDFSIKF